MAYRLAADVVLVVHLAFIVFMVGGGFLAWRWRRVMWLHAPVVVWGVAISLLRFRCPLTPLENHLRQLAGGSGYDGGFIDHYLASVVYPSGLTPTIQAGMAAVLVTVTAAAYGGVLLRRGARPAGPRRAMDGRSLTHPRPIPGAREAASPVGAASSG